jgi:hypothetical protein
VALSNPLGIFRDFRNPGGIVSRQARISQTFRPGSLCFARRGSEHAEIPLSTAPRPDLLVLGTFVGLASYTSGSVDDGTGGATNTDGSPAMVQMRPGIIGVGNGTGFATATSGANQIQAKHVDLPCFAFDDNTIYLTDNGGALPFAGFVDSVNQDGTVAIRCGEDQRVLFELYAAVGLTGATSATTDDSVSYAMTNLPAGTFSGGVWTATATGAISTTQDGLTVAPAAGDKVMFPPGTLTTLVVSAANSGPYECVTAGAMGVAAVYQRTARFAHGAIITPGTRVKVTLGGATTFSGTVWRADPTTTTKVVGTDDPVMFPERVLVQKTLAAGTATIATVPLRAAGKFGVYIDFNGGSPAATTTSIQASTQTPGGLGTSSIVLQEQSVLGTLVNTGTATCAVTVLQ